MSIKLLILWMLITGAQGQLLGVGVLTRHGDRELLHKEGYVETTTGTLTEKGYARMHWLGKVLESRYVLSDITSLNLSVTDYNLLHDEVLVKSSAFDRTIASAVAVMEGLFKNEVGDRIPPTFSETENKDITLRFYGKCGAIHEHMAAKRASSAQWNELKLNSTDLRTTTASLLNVSDSSMDGVWNMHDVLLSLAAENPTTWGPLSSEIKILLDSISDFDYSSASAVASAGYLLRDINAFIKGVTASEPTAQKLRLWSGHYPTIASLANLMELKLSGVPDFGAAVIIEVRREGGQELVDVFVLDQGDNWEPSLSPSEWDNYIKRVTPSSCSPCTVRTYLEATRDKERSKEEWCKECRTGLEMCASSSPTDGRADDNSTGPSIVLACFISFVAGALVVLLAIRMGRGKENMRRKAASAAARSTELQREGEAGFSGNPSFTDENQPSTSV